MCSPLRAPALKPTNIGRYLPDTDAAAKFYCGREKLYRIFSTVFLLLLCEHRALCISFFSHLTLLFYMFYISVLLYFYFCFFVLPLLFFVRGMDVMATITVSTRAIKLKGIHPSAHISTQTFFTTALTTLSSIKIED